MVNKRGKFLINKQGQIRKFSLCNFSSKNRRGQFFIIAAIVIITVIVSIATVSNYTQRKDVVKLYDLGQELGIESQQVLDYGTYNELNESEMKSLMETFIQNYVSYIEEKKNIYFVFGNKEKINVIGYQEIVSEDICVELNPTQVCGNGIVEKGEECDDGNLVSDDSCSSACKLETAALTIEKCVGEDIGTSLECCNNDKTETGEICDKTDLSGKTCELLGFVSGTLSCNSNCGFDTSSCVSKERECTSYLNVGETQEFSKTGEQIDKVVITISNVDYEFTLKEGENFYFVIWQEIGGEKHVVTN